MVSHTLVEAHARSFSVFRTPLSSHVILPYCPLKPWHTSVLAFLLRHTSVPSSSSLAYFRSASKIQVVFSFWYKYPGRTFLLCLKAVSSSHTAVNPHCIPTLSRRRSTVFQLDHWSFLVPNRGVVTRVFVGCRVFGCEMRVKVKLVLEDKLKIWSFESENINELTLPSVLEDVESLFNDQLRKRRLHAKLLYTDKDFGCEVEVETNLDLRSVLNDLADSWKCGEKASCVLTVRETLTVRREDTPLRISPSEACAKLGDEFSATVLSHASQLGERNDDSDEDNDSDCDIIEPDLFPDPPPPPPPQEKETPAATAGDVEAAEPPAKRTKRSRPRRTRGKDVNAPRTTARKNVGLQNQTSRHLWRGRRHSHRQQAGEMRKMQIHNSAGQGLWCQQLQKTHGPRCFSAAQAKTAQRSKRDRWTSSRCCLLQRKSPGRKSARTRLRTKARLNDPQRVSQNWQFR